MPASGKSTIARGLSKKLGIRVFHSDVLRKALFQHLPGDGRTLPFGDGIYSQRATSLTYHQLLLSAREALEQGKSVILDATFQTRRHRLMVGRLAGEMSASILFVECHAPDELMQERLIQRDTEPSISDARLLHFQEFKARFEPIDEIDRKMHLAVDTSNSLKKCLRSILRHVVLD